jgi:hypothetical protein
MYAHTISDPILPVPPARSTFLEGGQVWVFALFVLLLAGYDPRAAAQCTQCEKITSESREISYRVVLKYRNAKGTLVVHVSTGPSRFDRVDLVALACKLHRDFTMEDDLFVRIFDDKHAAKRYESPSDQHKSPDWEKYARSFRAFYEWQPEAKLHAIVWGFDPLVENSDYKHEDFCIPSLPCNPGMPAHSIDHGERSGREMRWQLITSNRGLKVRVLGF